MENFKYLSLKQIASDNGMKYTGITFDGNYFYLTQPAGCRILKYDMQYKLVNIIETSKSYSAICYDTREHCFWAVNNKGHNQVYKLNKAMLEMDCISVKMGELCGAQITGISYDCEDDLILLSFPHHIVALNKNSCIPPTIRLCIKDAFCLSVMSVAPYYIVACLRDNEEYTCIYTNEDRLLKKCAFSKEYIIEDFVLYFSNDKLYYYVLATKGGCYPYLIRFELDSSIDFFSVNCCNWLCCDKSDGCPNSGSATEDLLESIALMETALSSILNAESEKIQKILSSSCDAEVLLQSNNSTYLTLTKAIHLEQILFDKLIFIKEM